jgi:hypothetical protein
MKEGAVNNMHQLVLSEIYPAGWQRKLFSTRFARLTSTSEKAGKRIFHTMEQEKLYRPSTLLRVILVLAILTIWITVGFLIFVEQQFREPLSVFILLLPLLLTILSGYKFFTNPSTNYQLLIHGRGIELNDTLYPWSAIRETLILNIPRGRSTTDYLVVIMQNDTYWKVNISCLGLLWATGAKVSSVIEYFKQQGK